MIGIGLESFLLPTQSNIISFTKSRCGKYLAILCNNSLQIHSLIKKDFEKLSEFVCDGSNNEKRFYHWIQWISLNQIAFGTQSGYITFLTIENQITGSINEIKYFNFNQMLTAQSASFGALVLATSGPLIHFISPNGELLSTLSLISENEKPIPIIIRQINIKDNQALFVFVDGRVALANNLKQKEVIEKQPISIQFMEFLNNVSSAIFSDNKKYIIVLTFDGMLMQIRVSTLQISIISDDCSLFHITRDSSFIVALSPNGKMTTWSNKTGHSTNIMIDFASCNKSKTLNFVTSEIDFYDNRFFCATSNSNQVFIISYAKINHIFPSLLFHTSISLFVPTTNVTVAAPIDLIEFGYPVMHSAYLSSKKNIVISGRKYFALYCNSSNQWHFVKDEKYFCRTIWAHKDHFLSVVFDHQNLQYILLLMSSDNLAILSIIVLDGVFINCDDRGDFFAVGTSTEIIVCRIFRENMQYNIVCIYKYTNPVPYDELILLHNNRNVLLLSNNNELIELPSNTMIIESASYVAIAKEIDLLFIIINGKQFAMYYPEKSLIRLNNKIPGILVDNLLLMRFPNSYSIGNFAFEVDEFLPQVLFFFIDKLNIMVDLVHAYLGTNNISIAISHAMNLAFKDNKFDEFNLMLDHFHNVKETFLLIALFNVDDEYVPIIKSLLPPPKELITKYPNVAQQIEGIYSCG